MTILKYKTYADYLNSSGINQIALPIRDAVPFINPFFMILVGILFVLTTSSYYTYVSLTGRTRFFNSLLASSFVTSVLSIFFSLAGLITPYETITFMAFTVLSLALVIFYKK